MSFIELKNKKLRQDFPLRGTLKIKKAIIKSGSLNPTQSVVTHPSSTDLTDVDYIATPQGVINGLFRETEDLTGPHNLTLPSAIGMVQALRLIFGSDPIGSSFEFIVDTTGNSVNFPRNVVAGSGTTTSGTLVVSYNSVVSFKIFVTGSSSGSEAIHLSLSSDTGSNVATVTQATSITTPVTINSSIGLITTQTTTAAAGGSPTFTVNNNAVTSSSTILVSINDYSGIPATNGLPVILITTILNGSFAINIMNCHSVNALNGTLDIVFQVLN